jgi:oligopeptide/dipeptide ABC transporter ATP-binding protein
MEHTGLLDIHHLCVRYPCGKEILRDVSLHMHEGEIVCVIGESGCGKSTLLNAVLRLPRRVRISAGEVIYRGHNLLSLTEREMRSVRGTGLGVVFQEPGASLDPIRKIRVQFYEAMRAHERISRKASVEKAEEILGRMEFKDPRRVMESCPAQLSGGMNQRVATALAMVLKPDILLADEPTSALDVTVQAQIINELMRLRDEFGTCIVMITHDMGVVAKMADKVAVMYAGRVVEYGYRESVLRAPSHPYTCALMEAIPRLDGTFPKGIPGQTTETFPARGCAFAPRCPHTRKECISKEMQQISLHAEHWTLCREGEKT